MWWVALARAGTFTEVEADEPGGHYLVYTPEAWDPGAPLLVVLDPRGDAVGAAERFVPAADAEGWRVASSYDSRSDLDGADVTIPAVQRIVGELRASEVVLAGFSGTARAAWVVGHAAPGLVRGVVSVGAVTADGALPEAAPPFAWAGLAGVHDFNWLEVRAAQQAIATHGGAARFDTFDGGHAWPPAELLTRAIAFVARPEVEPPLPDEPSAAWEVGRAVRVRAVVERLVDPARSLPSVARARHQLGVTRLERVSARGGSRADAAERVLARARSQLGVETQRRVVDAPDRWVRVAELRASLAPGAAWVWRDLARACEAAGDPVGAARASAEAEAVEAHADASTP